MESQAFQKQVLEDIRFGSLTYKFTIHKGPCAYIKALGDGGICWLVKFVFSVVYDLSLKYIKGIYILVFSLHHIVARWREGNALGKHGFLFPTLLLPC